jgi:hypothetical protein
MFLSVDDDPSIVRAPMRGAVDVVHTGDKVALGWKEGLAVGEDRRVRASREGAIKIVVADNFHQPYVAIGHGDAEGKDFVIAMRAAVLGARGAGSDAADHYVVHRMSLLRSD